MAAGGTILLISCWFIECQTISVQAAGAGICVQGAICEKLEEMDQHPALYIDALQELAKWQEAEGLDNEALQTRGKAEKVPRSFR